MIGVGLPRVEGLSFLLAHGADCRLRDARCESARQVAQALRGRHGISRAPQGPFAVIEIVDVPRSCPARPLAQPTSGKMEVGAKLALTFLGYRCQRGDPDFPAPSADPAPCMHLAALGSRPDASRTPQLVVRCERLLMFEDGYELSHPAITVDPEGIRCVGQGQLVGS